MKNSKNQNVAEVENTVAAVTAEAPKTEEPKAPKPTPVHERRYRLVAEPSITPKGKQRQIVIAALKSSESPMTVKQVAKFASAAGLTAVGGIEPSCRYHLHHLVKLGFVNIENPTIEAEIAA